MENSYPTQEELDLISTWPAGNYLLLMKYVRNLWAYEGMGYFRQEGQMFFLSTAGWSGNESIIDALMENKVFWLMCWWSSKRGGHYKFKLPI